MNRIFPFILLLLVSTFSYSQELSLDSCQALARRNHPLLRQLGLIEQISSLRQQNIRTQNLPQFDFTARASWQSDVTKVSLNIPGFPGIEPLSKDQYKAYIDIRQKIFDGGVAKQREKIEEADRLVSQQQKETELYKIKETVNSLFFNVLILQENQKIMNLKKETLEAKIKIINSAVKNGATLPNELDQLLAEQLLTDQQETELNSAKQITSTLLEIITGSKIPSNTNFVTPVLDNQSAEREFNRPEITYFTLQQNRLDQNRDFLKISRKPSAFAFGQAGFGRPGLNMLNNNFADWYMFGAGLTWNIWDWHRTQRERATLNYQKDLINSDIQNLKRTLTMSLDQEESNYQKLKKLLISDEQIVVLKEQISRRSASALENGAITSADYLRDLNSSLQAKANLETHKIQLIQSTVNMKTIQGK
jgi:outer membrane protein TolC